jgi:integrase
MSDGLVQCNAASVKAPRPEKPEIKPLSPDQARKLIQTAREAGDRFEALYMLALHSDLGKTNFWGSGGTR